MPIKNKAAKVQVRLGELLPLVERDATKEGKPVSQIVAAIVAKHYDKPVPSFGLGYAVIPQPSDRARKRGAKARKNKAEK